LDADSMTRALETLDLKRTGLLTVSKSGSTAETMIQTLAAYDAFERAEAAGDLSARAVAITMPGDRLLRRWADSHEIPVLDHHPGVGGRFSVLTNVGLLPAALVGLDPHA